MKDSIKIAVGIFLGVIALCVLGVCLFFGLSAAGVSLLAASVPTPIPSPVLTVGKSYWVNALIPPIGALPAGLVDRFAAVYNKPGHPISDPSITVIAFVPDATELTLLSINQNWCYVRGYYTPYRDIPAIPTSAPDYNQPVEGWMECDRLLDYQPTPYPSPNPTPQAP